MKNSTIQSFIRQKGYPDFREVHIIKDHSECINCLILLRDGRIASCSDDKTIKIFSPTNYSCSLTIYGHRSKVYFITELVDSKLLSSSYQTMKLWKIEGNCYSCLITIFEAHEDFVIKMISLPNQLFASCSYDNFIKIWTSTPPYKCIKVLEEHTEGVSSLLLLLDERTFISGSFDESFGIWEVKTYKCRKMIYDIPCSEKNNLLEIDNQRILVGGYERITIINISTFQIDSKITEYSLGFIRSFLRIQESNIILFGSFGNIQGLELNSYKCIYKNSKSHSGYISSLVLLNNNIFASCSSDKTIKIWSSL